MLVLFDIDGTLLNSQRAGTRSMQEVGRELYGEGFTFDGVEIAGRIDPLIWEEAARVNGIDDWERQHERFRAAYAARLAERLGSGASKATLLPGVRDLIDALVGRSISLGVLTGNYAETGRLKIEAAGLEPSIFAVTAWGDDGASRRDLPPHAMAMHTQLTGQPVAPDQVLVIGDTPHDVDCAQVNGCRCILVATGAFPRSELISFGADLVVDDLSDTAMLMELVETILEGSPA